MRTQRSPSDAERMVAENVRAVRNARGLSMRQLAIELRAIGHPLLPSALSELETGQRRVDVADLLALAVVLGVSPLRLLMPLAGRVRLVGGVEVDAADAWIWGRGVIPLDAGPFARDIDFYDANVAGDVAGLANVGRTVGDRYDALRIVRRLLDETKGDEG